MFLLLCYFLCLVATSLSHNLQDLSCGKRHYFLFHCGNGHFVRSSMVCDDKNDCENGSDEATCYPDSVSLMGKLDEFVGTTNSKQDDKKRTNGQPSSTSGIRYLVQDVSEQNAVVDIRLRTYETRTIISPGYPVQYHPNLNLTWKVSTMPGYKIRLDIQDFHLQNSLRCYADSLAVYDSTIEYHNRLAVFCGEKPVPNLISPENAIVLNFRTDEVLSFKGFKIGVTSICGGVLEGSFPKALVSHASYGVERYGKNQSCGWNIKGYSDHRLELQFQNFSVGTSSLTQDNVIVKDCEGNFSGDCLRYALEPSRCFDDFVDVFDGSDDTSRLIERLCGHTVPLKIRSSGPKMFLRFRSGDGSGSLGFRAIVKIV